MVTEEEVNQNRIREVVKITGYMPFLQDYSYYKWRYNSRISKKEV